MKYISVSDYLKGRDKLSPLTPEMVSNMNTLIPKINDLLEAFGEYRACSSGYRPTDINKTAKGSAKSWHIKCAAIDLYDPDEKLDLFCVTNVALLEKLGLWLESPTATKTWCHLQIFPPRSGNRVFSP